MGCTTSGLDFAALTHQRAFLREKEKLTELPLGSQLFLYRDTHHRFAELVLTLLKRLDLLELAATQLEYFLHRIRPLPQLTALRGLLGDIPSRLVLALGRAAPLLRGCYFEAMGVMGSGR